MFWDKQFETMSGEKMLAHQSVALQKAVRYVYANVPFYKEQFDAHGITPEQVTSIDDITALPFTVKSDLRAQYPYGLCAVPVGDISRLHASSGTTGNPTPVFNTRTDMKNWSNCMDGENGRPGEGLDRYFHSCKTGVSQCHSPLGRQGCAGGG